MRAWFVVWEIAGLCALGVAIPGETLPTGEHWITCAFLVSTALVHGVCTRSTEERRRGARLAASGDGGAWWNLAAALLLPLLAALPVLLVIRVLRYRIARKPPAKFCFTTTAIGTSMLLAHAAGYQAFTAPGNHVLLAVSALAAIAGYFAGQTLLIGVALGMTTDWGARWQCFGDRTENQALLLSSCAATAAAVVLRTSPMLALVLLPVAIATTQLNHRHALLQHERDELHADALHDPLTGLPNRRGFGPWAEAALTADLACERDCAVLMADIDHFKNWNTQLGHFGADVVLQRVAEILRAQTRHADLLCRWGGEELAVVLPSTTPEEALQLAERIRIAISAARIVTSRPSGEHPVTLGVGEWPPVTVSIGLAVAPEHGADLATVQAAADTALQTAKDSGRNRVAVADLPTRSTGEPPARATPKITAATTAA